MIAFKLSSLIALSESPCNMKEAIIEDAYSGDTSYAMALEAALKVINDIPGAVRHTIYEVNTSTWETVSAWIEGKFVFVEF